ncbi:MAG: hypothetical protein KDJ54_07870 [Candidatus Competibacteraceae bacterium]|nr:hypothetical protein [Candidatus Competibacteraceae bacterium]
MKRNFLKTLFLVSISYASYANAAIVARDNFEYQVDKTGSITNFYTQGIWRNAKTNQTHPQEGSILFTTTSIPGFSGSFPGTNSTRVLGMEIRPSEVQPGWLQSDVYLQFGGESSPAGTLPANHWIQFWLYVNRYGDQLSEFDGGKFLYPSPTGTYGVPYEDTQTLFTVRGSSSAQPYNTSTTSPGQWFFMNRPSHANNSLAPQEDQNKLGANLGGSATPARIDPNAWYLIKLHFDTSGASPLAPAGQGVWEMWIRRADSDFVKVAEWIGGVTPNFTWPIIDTTGFKSLRMPTTIDTYNAWIYMDDFVIATTEADLPIYNVGNQSQLTSPNNLIIVVDRN